MKKIFAGMLAWAAITGLGSCSEDFNVAAPFKEVTVGYGLLNMSDSVHYIRIQKAFLDESKSAIDMSKISDSSYRDLDVRIREINSSDRVVTETVLQRVDLNEEGYAKEPGAFFPAPNYAYQYKYSLNPSYKYRIIIKNSVTGKTDSAETVVLSSNPQEDLSDFNVFEFRQSNFNVKFQNEGRPNGKFAIEVRTPENAKMLEGIIRFHWTDRNIVTNEEQDYSADWTFNTADVGNRTVTLTTTHSAFYAFLANAMQAAPDQVERYIDSCDMFVWAGTQDLYTYQQYAQASGGLTGDQIRPNYTNFKGTDVLGLFASRAVKMHLQVPIEKYSIDSLMLNPLTSPLKIRGVSDH